MVDLLTGQITKSELNNFAKVNVELAFAGTNASSAIGNSQALAKNIHEYFEQLEASCTGPWNDVGRIALSRKHCFGPARDAAIYCEHLAKGNWGKYKEEMIAKFPVEVTIDSLFEKLTQEKRKKGETLELFMVRLLKLKFMIERLDNSKELIARDDVVRTFLRDLPKKFNSRVTPAMRANTDLLLKEAVKWAEGRPSEKLSTECILKEEVKDEILAMKGGKHGDGERFGNVGWKGRFTDDDYSDYSMNVQCFNCEGWGHRQDICPSPLQEYANSAE